MEYRRKLNYFFAIISIVYLFLILPCHIPAYFPMAIDSGSYGYVGQELNRGKLLYKEVTGITFPAIYYIHYWIFKIFPDSRWTLYFVDIFVNILLLFFIYLIFKNFKQESFFWLISILFTTCYRVYISFRGGNFCEHFFLLFYFLSFSLLVSSPSPIKDFILGISFVFLFMFKQTFILFTIPLLIFYYKRVKKSNFFYLGFILGFSFFLIVFIRGFPESIIDTILFPLGFSNHLAKTKKWANCLARIKPFIFDGPGVQFSFIFLISLFIKDKLKFLLVSSAFASFIIYFLSPWGDVHYLIPLIIPIVIGSIIITKNLSEKFVIPLILVLSFFPLRPIYARIGHSRNAIKMVLVKRDLRIVANPIITPQIIKNLNGNETFIMIPSDPTVYFLTKTQSPFRFYGFYCALPFYKEELKKLIREKPPDYVYLDRDIKEFEETFSLTADEYILKKIDTSLYRFILVKKN